MDLSGPGIDVKLKERKKERRVGQWSVCHWHSFIRHNIVGPVKV